MSVSPWLSVHEILGFCRGVNPAKAEAEVQEMAGIYGLLGPSPPRHSLRIAELLLVSAQPEPSLSWYNPTWLTKSAYLELKSGRV
jgi:hypothetical protein